MKCYCKETESEFIFCVEDAPESAWDEVEMAFFQKEETCFYKKYPNDIPDKEIISKNFSIYAPDMFLRKYFDWEKALDTFYNIAKENSINWYLAGSMVATIRGIEIVPHDIDITVNVEDFEKTRVAFSKYIIEPFVDNGGSWVVRYFGRLCISGVMIDIAADQSLQPHNMELDDVCWRHYSLKTETLQKCFDINVIRNRSEHAQKIKVFLDKSNKVE